YIVERIVDQAAREMGLDPADIRRRNFIQPEDMPYQTPVGPTYDVGDFPAVLEAGLKKADRDGFETRRQQSEANGKLRGIGIGYYIEQSGGGFFETVNLKFPGDGTVVAYMGTQDNGQGHQIAYKQVLADQFEIDLDQVVIKQGDTDTSGFGMTGGSRSLPVGGGVLVGVAGKVKDKGKQIAAKLLEAAVADIEFSGGAFNIAGTDRSVGLFDVAEAARDPKNLPEGMEPGLDDSDIFADAGMTFPNGCHVAEIEIDPETGDVSVVKYTAVDDFGNIVNPLLVDGQNHGGITQGIGQALFEHTVYGEDGQLQTGSFMDYTMPRADGVPSFSLSFLNTPATGNPLGLKGVAEAGTIAAPPAVMNAIVDALHRRKEQVQIDMPATPLAVWQALNA
ncbi:MAG TPA: molybdopterin cofactor-binding domain-containing protein, partial [Alphaproteobacteria bacterium]|nr:molybdopterin cofactor-binding domain-containing protein [Alphaproteobacteria bacterium]